MSLLQESLSYKPFKYPQAMLFAQQSENSHWTEDELELQNDIIQWKSLLTEQEKNLLHQILKLFTQSDASVAKVYTDFLLPRLLNNEVRCMLLSFAAREGIHMRAYARLNETLGFPDSDWYAFKEYAVMKEKLELMEDCHAANVGYVAKAIAQQVFNEGVSLFASFIMLLNFKRFGKMIGTNTAVEWSIVDESLHVEGNSWLFKEVCKEYPEIVKDEFKKEIYERIRKVVKLEDKFVDLAFEMGDVEGLTPEDVKKYVRYIADRRLIQLGLKGNWKVKTNPLPWVNEQLASSKHQNFFEKRVTEYSVVGMKGQWPWESELCI